MVDFLHLVRFLVLRMSSVTTAAQPDNNGPDWELAKSLYTQGITLKEIAQRVGVQIGTLTKRAYRGRWIQLKTNTKQVLSMLDNGKVELKAVPDSPAQLATASDTVRKSISDELLSVMEGLGSIPKPKSLVGHSKRLEVLKGVVDVAKPAYGWSDGSASSVINILNLESAKVVEPPAIDVTATPVPPCSS